MKPIDPKAAFLLVALSAALVATACDDKESDSSLSDASSPADDADTTDDTVDSGTPIDAVPCRLTIDQGELQGKVENTTCEYLGIPFAKPPIGELRFAAPEPAEGWEGVRDATAFGAACHQIMDLSGSDVKSEDCLFVNVYTPMTAPAEPLPVMVFVHGGGFTGGATNTYPGRGLSEKGPVVFASMNYRLGPLGFFAHPDLDAENPDKPSGSAAIRDQQLALQWVQDNIASFNGDPNNVTLFGESAGSGSVCVHIVSPGSRGLSHRFIMESGVCTSGVANGLEPFTQSEMFEITALMVDDLCPGESDPIGCLRALPAETINRWTPSDESVDLGRGEIDWAPVIEGENGVLPEHPDALIQSGKMNPGEVIVGTNLNEYGLFQIVQPRVETVDAFRTRLETQFGDAADEIVAVYGLSSDAGARQTYITLMTDVMFRCASRELARMLEQQGSSVYLYSFEHSSAYHASEMAYVFGEGYPGNEIVPPVQPLVEIVQAYWINFAYTGDPNGEGSETWPAYETASDQHIVLKEPASVGSALQQQACDYWASYNEN